MPVVIVTSLFGHRNTTFLVVSTKNGVPSGQLNNHIPARSSSTKENPVSEEHDV
ncbi:hypothetical protein INT48_000113, partial [Thamnidium elegans]